MSNSNPTVYVKIKKHAILSKREVTIGDIASITCADQSLHDGIQKMPFYTFGDEGIAKNGNPHKNRSCNAEGKSDPQMEFFTILRVISLIQEKYPQVQIESIGEQDFIVEYKTEKSSPTWMNHCKVAILCIVIFFGSAFTIMAFNNDISVTEIFTRFYEQLMGVEKPAVSELEIAYSIGLAVGILVFFNHFGRRKFTTDPTPIQVEVNKFSSDCEDTLIENASQKGHIEDALIKGTGQKGHVEDALIKGAGQKGCKQDAS